MKNTGKQITFLQKKLEHLDNDLVKLIIKDLFKKGLNSGSVNSIELLKESYISEIKALRNKQKKESKQLDIEEEAERIKSLGNAYNC